MSFLSTILNFFGTKSDRDMKELAPIVEEILTHDTYFTNLSNNELREKTFEFKSGINLIVDNFNKHINSLKNDAKNISNRNEKEKIYKQIDELKKNQHLEINKQ